MGWSLTIGRIAGTDIRLHFTFLLFLIWIGVTVYLMRGRGPGHGGLHPARLPVRDAA